MGEGRRSSPGHASQGFFPGRSLTVPRPSTGLFRFAWNDEGAITRFTRKP